MIMIEIVDIVIYRACPAAPLEQSLDLARYFIVIYSYVYSSIVFYSVIFPLFL